MKETILIMYFKQIFFPFHYFLDHHYSVLIKANKMLNLINKKKIPDL